LKKEVFNIAVVDDEEILINEITEFLEDVSYLKVKSYTDPIEVLSQYNKFRPQIVLSDLMMPQMSGLELLAAIKQKSSDIEFIIMTGYGDMDSTIKAMQNRAANFLIKPVRLELLLEYINRSIEYIKREKQKQINQLILRHTDKMVWLGMLGSKVLHDSQNSITYIKGNIDNLRSYYYPIKEAVDYYIKNYDNQSMKKKLEFIIGDYGKLLDCMIEGADKLLNISENIYQMGICETTNSEMNEIKIVDLVNASLDIINYFKKSNISINYIKHEEIELKIFGKQTELELAIVNILLNALYSCEEKAGAIINIETTDCQRKIVLTITHNGAQIPTENVDNIFDPFFANQTRNKQFWIGLAVSKRVISEHNGQIDVKQLKEKTVFSIEFNKIENQPLK